MNKPASCRLHTSRPVRFAAILLGMAILFCASPVFAESYTATHTYVMGDSESKNQARIQCLNEAKRKIAEQAGAYIEVKSKTENFALTEDEVTSFSAAVARVEILDETWSAEGKSLAVTLKVRGDVDPEKAEAALQKLVDARIAHEAAEREKREQEQQEAAQAHERREQPQQAEKTSNEKPFPAPSRPINPALEYQRVKQDQERVTRLAAAYAEKGMTEREIVRILGRPGLAKQDTRANYTGYKYGHVWVMFKNDVVACVRSRLEYVSAVGGELHCSGMGFNFIQR